MEPWTEPSRTLCVPADLWLDRLDSEYLSDFVRSGGSAVKFVSGSPETLALVTDAIRERSEEHDYLYAHLDPAMLRPDGKNPALHRIDHFFFAVTQGVDWKQWVANETRALLERKGIRVATGRALNDVDGIAEDNGRDVTDLLNQYQRECATPRIRDRRLTLEFRSALAMLGRAQLIPDTLTPTTEEVLLEWLAGRVVKGGAAALKKIQVFGRIDKTNARHMLASFCRWLALLDRSGLVVTLDFTPYQWVRESPAKRNARILYQIRAAIARGESHADLDAIGAEMEQAPPVNYGPFAYMEMLQLLRRFIDEIEGFERMCLVVLTDPGFYEKLSARNFEDYGALETRIRLEVHDKDRANPEAALVHLEETP